MAKATNKSAAKKGTGKRTLISPRGDNRFVRRNEKGQIMESDDQGKSLSRDIKKSSKTTAKPGQGDRGDQKKTAPKKAAAKKVASKKAPVTKSASKKSSGKK